MEQKQQHVTLSARYQQGQLYYVVSDHQGTVREILTEEGELIWAGRLLTWGEPEFWRVLTLNDPRNLTCNLRFSDMGRPITHLGRAGTLAGADAQ